jgi:hypothetical protein
VRNGKLKKMLTCSKNGKGESMRKVEREECNYQKKSGNKRIVLLEGVEERERAMTTKRKTEKLKEKKM